jgi:glycosyltransferase involved in cell wall biosynthesis
MPGDLGGCGFYRCFEPARVVSSYGLTVEVNQDLETEAYIQPTGETEFRSVSLDADVVVLQRPVARGFSDLIPFLQRKGMAVVVEIDDDLMATPVTNIAHRSLNPKYNSAANWDWLYKACQMADLVTCSTPNLGRRYAPHGRFAVLRNLIPEQELKRDKTPADHLRVGWSGTAQTHAEDLIVPGVHVNAGIQQWAEDFNFYVVGDGVRVKESLMLSGEVVPTGWVPRENYIETVNNHFDIGIVPLKLDEFNRGKSWLKQMEMASQGIPSVVSPTEENIELAKITGNQVVHKPQHWQRGLKALLTDRDYYLERSAAVRESVSHLTYENHADLWIDAWRQAIDNRFAARSVI